VFHSVLHSQFIITSDSLASAIVEELTVQLSHISPLSLWSSGRKDPERW